MNGLLLIYGIYLLTVNLWSFNIGDLTTLYTPYICQANIYGSPNLEDTNYHNRVTWVERASHFWQNMAYAMTPLLLPLPSIYWYVHT